MARGSLGTYFDVDGANLTVDKPWNRRFAVERVFIAAERMSIAAEMPPKNVPKLALLLIFGNLVLPGFCSPCCYEKQLQLV